MRVTFSGILVGMAIYWGIQHFTGFGTSGRGKAGG